MKIYHNVIRVTVPTTHPHISRSSPFPSYIRKLILPKRIASKRYKVSKNVIHLLNFCKLVTKMRSSLQAHCSARQAILLNSRDHNGFFGHIKKLISSFNNSIKLRLNDIENDDPVFFSVALLLVIFLVIFSLFSI